MTPQEALERRKKLDSDKWQADAAIHRLHVAATKELQSQCKHDWRHLAQFRACKGCDKYEPIPKKVAKKKASKR